MRFIIIMLYSVYNISHINTKSGTALLIVRYAWAYYGCKGSDIFPYIQILGRNILKKLNLESAFEVEFTHHVQRTGDEYKPKE